MVLYFCKNHVASIRKQAELPPSDDTRAMRTLRVHSKFAEDYMR